MAMMDSDDKTMREQPVDIPRPQDPLGSPVLCTVARIACPLTLLVAAIIFWQGHNLPGGGFIAGVLGAAAGAMTLLGWGTESRVARFAWWRMSVIGLGISLLTGLILMLTQSSRSFMDHVTLHVPVLHHLPTAVFFDLGVFMIVVGTLMTVFVELGREEGRP